MRLPTCVKPQPHRPQSPSLVLELPRSPQVLNAPDLPFSAPAVQLQGRDSLWAPGSAQSGDPMSLSAFNAPMPCPAMTQELVVRRPQSTAMAALTLTDPPMPQVHVAREAYEISEKRKRKAGLAQLEESPSVKGMTAQTFAKHTAVFLSASGGVGLSALCSLTALQLADQGRRMALVDADFGGGGLDILLGLENDKGLRFGTLNAPLGKIDGDVLCKRLPHWEGVPVLAFDSWNSEIPEWWEVKAVMAALERSASVDMVLVDGARGQVIDMVPDLRAAPVVIISELSVLGLARAKALLNALASGRIGSSGQRNAGLSSNIGDGSLESLAHRSFQSQGDGFVQDSEAGYSDSENRETPQLAAIVGIEPRGTSRRRGVVSVNEASEYLDHRVLGPVCPNSARTSDALEGLGLKLAKADRAVIVELAHAVSDAVEGGERH